MRKINKSFQGVLQVNIYFHWEENLLSLALNALEHDHAEDPHLPPITPLLTTAYQHCEEITKVNSKTFYLATHLLPEGKRQAVRSLYAFCRLTDDIVDRDGYGSECSAEDPRIRLMCWQKQAMHPIHNHHYENIDPYTLVALAWQDARKRYRVPVLYSKQLVNGVAYDLLRNRYSNFPELASYCYGVACTVGLMSMHIVGHSGPEAIPYAIRLGVALQLTNILRDVGEDWRMGRLYLPKDELEAFGLTEEDIDHGLVTTKWREFMRFQIERVRLLYGSVAPGYAMLHREGRLAISAAADLYRAILAEIESNDYDVFSRRASVSKVGKLRRLPGIWWRSHTKNYPKINISPSTHLPGSRKHGYPKAQNIKVDG
jgi:15-cis-phytoene synthase